MKKIYYCVVAIVTLIFIYYIIKFAPTVTEKAFVVMSNSISDSSNSIQGTFAFKSTLERSDLLKDYIDINTDFLNNSPLPPSEKREFIKNFYKLEKFFADFRYYYASKQKIYKIIFEELPLLFKNTKDLSDNGLESYFNDNKKYLNGTFGIENVDDFVNFIDALSPLKDSSISSYELENSYFYITIEDILSIRIILHLDNSENIYLSSKIEPYNMNDYQSMPLVKFFTVPTLGFDY